METNAVDLAQSFEDFGVGVSSSIVESLGGIANGFDASEVSSTVLSFSGVILGGFLVVLGFWIAVKHLFRAARSTR